MPKKTLLLTFAVGLSGCVAVWGRGYQVESESPDAVTIKYDHHFASPDDVAMVAEANCERFDKSARSSSSSTSIWGLTSVSFVCAGRRNSTRSLAPAVPGDPGH
jgi:hypothetical protein